ncbi:Oxygen-independent coproporphyrinogen-III oxidase N-terminal domain protein [Candidatus Cyrtobacter comes]|uniref:Oxygen-independent coproporphyrinogen-III oxidase N-terminal domain protein n=1 Tax=Candidatus Cyrtobacter comes TaxID=675776 RepID=A0ABU5L6V9_9RICK|nr:Oxygen-independent coproporphyrinogen-III oxidase N-terminal domain protein [Candidatus Cyrtobacter comes]
MISLYIHWPFCESKCPYCDFNSHVSQSEINTQYWLTAYIEELKSYHDILSCNEIGTIFFGGGNTISCAS